MNPFLRWLINANMLGFALLGTQFFALGFASYFVTVDGLMLFGEPVVSPQQRVIWMIQTLLIASIGFAYLLVVNKAKFRVSTVLALTTLVAVTLGTAVSSRSDVQMLILFATLVFCMYWPTRKLKPMDAN